MEVPEAIAVVKRWWTAKFKGQTLEDDPKHWRIPLAAFGLMLVILGVGAETIFESLNSNAETALRGHDEQVLANTIAEAGSAKDSAHTAASDATTAKGDAESAGKEASLARKGEAELERENAALRAKMAPRRVSGEEAKELCPEIHLDGNRSMDIASSSGTSETDDFAEDIGRAIVNCQHGLSVRLHKQVLMFPIPTPLRIAYAPNRKADAQMLNDALVKTHIAAKAIEMVPVPNPDQQPDALSLFVGPKVAEP
jgi:hypothetical protein